MNSADVCTPEHSATEEQTFPSPRKFPLAPLLSFPSIPPSLTLATATIDQNFRSAGD